jgi:outer membrane lipoprotein-sorting protein
MKSMTCIHSPDAAKCGRHAALRALVIAMGLLLPTNFAWAAAASTEPDAAAIVQKADEVRFPAESFEATVTIDSVADGQPADPHKYRILSKGNDNTIVMVTEPAADRGQILLMKGHDLWVFLPHVSQPVRLSLSQRLTGEVANGDLARVNFAGDYEATLVRTEAIDTEPMYVLELKARERNVTYRRVLYWVRKANFWPYKAEFYSISDRLLKTARYEEFKQIAGRLRPTRLVMQDALRQEDRSTLDYTDIRKREIPDRVFTKDYLKRLE